MSRPKGHDWVYVQPPNDNAKLVIKCTRCSQEMFMPSNSFFLPLKDFIKSNYNESLEKDYYVRALFSTNVKEWKSALIPEDCESAIAKNNMHEALE